MTPDVAGILRQGELLRAAPDEVVQIVVAASRLRPFRRGQVVFSKDDPSDTLIVVISGRVKVAIRSADGGELTLTIVTAGGMLGELSIADSGPRSADALTLEESRLLLIPRETMQQVCSRVPAVAQALASSIAVTLRRLTEATSDLVFLDLPRRIAKAVLTLPRDKTGVIVPAVSQEELAHHVGGTRQSVNAALRGFERRGWIEVNGRAVTVRQPAALNRFAGDGPSAG